MPVVPLVQMWNCSHSRQHYRTDNRYVPGVDVDHGVVVAEVLLRDDLRGLLGQQLGQAGHPRRVHPVRTEQLHPGRQRGSDLGNG